LELSRLVKKVMENRCWKEREMEHMHLERWICASGKWVILRHEWSSQYWTAHGWKRLSMDLFQSSLRFKWSWKPRGIFISLFFHFFFSYFLFSYFFSSSFFLSFIFFFLFFYSSFFMLLQTFRQHSTCYSSPPPMLK
jgi:hypothetical protein